MRQLPGGWRAPAFAVAIALTASSTAVPAAGQQGTPSPALPEIRIATAGSRTTGTSAISGVVVDATTSRPVPGAVVILSNLDSSVATRPHALTDSRGRFVFMDLPASDSYYLGARRFGYAYTRYGWSAPDQSRAIADISRVVVADGQWRSDLRIPLWRTGAISGRVVDERGEPVVGVVVRAFTQGTISGHSQLVGGPLTTTDDRGVYRISGMSPGRYAVSVLSVQSTVLSTTEDVLQTRPLGALQAGGLSGTRGSTVAGPTIDVTPRHRLALTNFATPPPPGSESARAYPPLFFPGVTDGRQAQVLEIGYGSNRTDVDFQLEPVRVVRVSGRVDAPSGARPGLLRLMPEGRERLGFGSEAATTLIEPDGRFTFLNVPAGSYTLLAQASVIEFGTVSPFPRLSEAPGFPGGGAGVGSLPGAPGLSYIGRSGQAATLWGRAAVVVGDQDLDDVVLPLRPTVTVRGRVVFADGTPPPSANEYLELMLEPATGDPSAGTPRGSTVPGASEFTIEGLLGAPYLVGYVYPHRSGPGTGNVIIRPYGVVSMMHQGRDLRYTGFDASSGTDFDNVVLTLTDKPIELNGTVQSDQGPSAATVIAFPVDRERWTNFGWRVTWIASARSSSAGAYRIQGLSEGEYYVVAVPLIEPTAWMNPDFMAAAAPRATRIAVKWGETSTIDLRVAEIPRP
jgi:hypothetical protein